MTLDEFEARCAPAAADLEDRLNRYVSSQQDWDVAYGTLWPFIVRALIGRFPWECVDESNR